MSWFRKKEPSTIPPVNESTRSDHLGSGTGAAICRGPSPGPISHSYNPSPSSSANNDPYGRYQSTRGSGGQPVGAPAPGGPVGATAPAPSRGLYHRNNPIGDPYSHGQRDLNQDRSELFSGYDPQKHKSTGKFTDGPATRDYPPTMDPGADEEDEVEGIKKQTRALKQDSAVSTRNALRIAREAEETARNTLTKLGDQSEKLANTERHLDVSKGYVNRVEDKQDELKQLNRSIFRPVIVFNKDAKRLAQENKLLQRHEEEREEHEKAMRDIRDTQNRIGQAQAFRGDDYDEEGYDEEGIGGGGGSGRFRTAEALAKKKDARKRFQFEATASDDEVEDEIDNNLDEIDDVAKRLKALSSAMGQELDNHNARLERLDNKTTNLDNKLHLGIRRFDKFT